MPSWVKVYWLRLSYPVWLKTRSTMTWGVLIYPAKCVGEGWPQELVVERERVWWGLSEKFKHWGAPVVKGCAGKKPHLLWWEDHPVTKGLQWKLTIKYVVGIVLGSKTCSLAMCIGCQVGPRMLNLRLLNPVISTAFFPQNPQRVENSWEGCESNESYLYQLNPSICFLPVRTEGLDSRPPQPSPHTQGGNLLLQSPSNVRSRSWSLSSLSLQNLALVLLLPLSDTFGSHIYIGCIYPWANRGLVKQVRAYPACSL
jgi:hypothetical protein